MVCKQILHTHMNAMTAAMAAAMLLGSTPSEAKMHAGKAGNASESSQGGYDMTGKQLLGLSHLPSFGTVQYRAITAECNMRQAHCAQLGLHGAWEMLSQSIYTPMSMSIEADQQHVHLSNRHV